MNTARTRASDGRSSPRIMRAYVKPESAAEEKRHPRATAARPSREALAPGFQPRPEHDLKFRGGHTIAHLKYMNFFVGGSGSWNRSDVDSINTVLAKAMSDPGLNNVMRQYFANQEITTAFLSSQFVGSKRPKLVTQTSVEKLVTNLFTSGHLSGLDFTSTVLNFMLPAGTVLTDGRGPGQLDTDHDEDRHRPPGSPEIEEASSRHGLGGYHGSVDVAGKRIYYAVGVFSQRLPGGGENGIPAFGVPWKDVVATFYHELNEARTDPDVDEAIKTGRVDGIIGWNSDAGEECGDFPVFEAGSNLALVFQEVPIAGGGTVPVQFQYSNAAHGPEGPIASPHMPAVAHELEDAASESRGRAERPPLQRVAQRRTAKV